MTAKRTDTPLDLECGHCHALAGKRCRRGSRLLPKGQYHAVRATAWDRATNGPSLKEQIAAELADVKQESARVAELLRSYGYDPTKKGHNPSVPGKGTFQISDAAADVLRRVTYVETASGSAIQLPENLERSLYVEVNACLERAGVKWDRFKKMHVPKRGDNPRGVITTILESGKAPHANPGSFYPTPFEVFDNYLVPHLDLFSEPLPDRIVNVLDPSCGEGHLLRYTYEALPDSERGRVRLVGIEVDRGRLEHARSTLAADDITYAQHIIWGDFLATDPDPWADYILMNPPFSAPGAALLWLDHVQHAIGWLAPGGQLVSVVPGGFHHRAMSRRISEFRAFLQMCGGWVDVPAGMFKDSGTEVSTSVLWLRRDAA